MIIVSHQALQAGADVFGCDVNALRLLERGGAPDGAVYEYQQADRVYYLKFVPTAPDKMPAVEEKIAFVHYLRGGGAHVLEFVPSVRQRLVETVEAEDQVYAVSNTVKAPGRHLRHDDPADWTPRFFQQWGQTLGRMHALARRYAGGVSILRWRDEHTFFANWCSDEAVREKWQALGAVLAALPEDRDAFGLIHNDLHSDNMLLDGDTLTVLDFDVCTHHWFMTDIGIALFHPIWFRRDPGFAATFAPHFMEGYCREHTLSRFWLDQLPTFLRYRQILFYIAMSHEGDSPWLQNLLAGLKHSILNDLPITDVRL